MHVNMIYQKNRIDGNIYPIIHTGLGKEPKKVVETNSDADSILCIFGDDETTTEGIIAPVSTSHLSSTN